MYYFLVTMFCVNHDIVLKLWSIVQIAVVKIMRTNYRKNRINKFSTSKRHRKLIKNKINSYNHSMTVLHFLVHTNRKATTTFKWPMISQRQFTNTGHWRTNDNIFKYLQYNLNIDLCYIVGVCFLPSAKTSTE